MYEITKTMVINFNIKSRASFTVFTSNEVRILTAGENKNKKKLKIKAKKAFQTASLFRGETTYK